MFRPVARHNINLDWDELFTILNHLPAARASSGDKLRAFEDEFAAYHGVRHAVALSSGRVALYAILKALELQAGGEVVVPAYSFFSLPDVVRHLGFVPVFAACHPRNFALDPGRLDSAFSDKTVALIVEHPFGQPAPMEDIMAVAGRRGLPVIEDPSQSIGAALDGRPVGTFGRAACMSLIHGKNLMTFGGGVVLTDDDGIYGKVFRLAVEAPEPAPERVRRNALNGIVKWLMTTKSGFAVGPFLPFYLLNLLDRARLDAVFREERSPFSPGALEALSNLQAALGLVQLERLDARNARRRGNALALLEGLGGIGGLTLPEMVPGAEGTWNTFPVRVADAEAVQRRLFIRGVDTRTDYMSIFAFEEEWRKAGQVFYLPNHPGLDDGDIRRVIRATRWALGKEGF